MRHGRCEIRGPRGPGAFRPYGVALLILLAVVFGTAGCGTAGGAEGGRSGAAAGVDEGNETMDADQEITRQEVSVTGPRAVVLGVAHDGGQPHAGCDCRRCRHALAHPQDRPLVASLGIVLPESGRTFLIDATPDVALQLRALRHNLNPEPPPAPRREGGVDRAPVDGVFLTHAHVGHYLGLAHFGREVVSTTGLPVWGTPRMLAFLRDNGPWSQLVDLGNVELRPVEPGEGAPGEAVELGEGVSVAALRVPHREEFSDAVGYVVRGPRSALLYVPDTDGWDAWAVASERVMEAAGIDVALVDGTFHSGDELPGRDLSKVRHPFIGDSVERFTPFVERTGVEIHFLHFNHTNPALDPFEPLDTSGWPPGLALARQGEEWPL